MKTFSFPLKIRKRACIWSALLLLSVAACNKTEVLTDQIGEPPSPIQRSCATDEHFEHLLQGNPAIMKIRNAIEVQTQNFIRRVGKQGRSIASDGSITIPVAIHVIYSQPDENISLAQIQSQIDVLNQDFNATNPDFLSIPSIFQSAAANFQMSFVLKSVDRRSSTQTGWNAGAGLYKSSSTGGLDAVSTGNTLNIWVCRILRENGDAVLGYAPYPGSVSANLDGVSVAPYCFGSVGYLSYPYDAGRTATHEIGHWLNLVHIWGNQQCGNDEVDDTPVHTTANSSCPGFPLNSTCTGQSLAQMTMNYMDYTDDRCMYMFTNGQKARARALFQPGAYRYGFVSPTVLTISGANVLCPSNTVTYTINNVPAGAVVTWSHTMGTVGSVVSTSGNSITIAGNGTGSATLSATVTDPGYSFSVDPLRISFGTVMPGGITATTGPTIGCDRMKLEIVAVPGATSYKWYVDGALQVGTTGRSITRLIESDGVDHLIEVQAVNPCGTSAKRSKIVRGWCGT